MHNIHFPSDCLANMKPEHYTQRHVRADLATGARTPSRVEHGNKSASASASVRLFACLLLCLFVCLCVCVLVCFGLKRALRPTLYVRLRQRHARLPRLQGMESSQAEVHACGAAGHKSFQSNLEKVNSWS